MDPHLITPFRRRLQELEAELQKPENASDPLTLARLSQEYARVKGIVDLANTLEEKQQELQEFQDLLDSTEDEKEQAAIEEEIQHLEQEIQQIERDLRARLIPRDPADEKNAVVEIRAGTGGEEAALFARDLFKMYLRYAEDRGWRVSITDLHETELGGIREVTFLVEGKGAYGALKYESGVHRVQRVPVTESGGRIHTSSASVVVLPEADEIEVEIRPEDLKIETFRAGGPGGQYVNVTDSAVRITHLPTGITVSCQDERSQHKNKQKALRILRSRLRDRLQEEEAKKTSAIRKAYIGTGDRSEKIRTYNFPQNRVTDHRIGLTLYALDSVLEGNLQPIIDALRDHEDRKRLEDLQSTGSGTPKDLTRSRG